MPVSTADWIRAVIQIALLTVVFYNFYIALAQNRATQLIRSILIYAFLYVICRLAGLKVLSDVLRIAAGPAAVFLFVLYQPELRRTFTPGVSKIGRAHV